MRVLISALNRFSQTTGICRNAGNQVLALASLGEISEIGLIIGRWQIKSFASLFSLPKVSIITADCRNTSFARNLWFWNGLPKAASRFRPDLVHMSFPVPFRRSAFSVPVVATVHDLYPFEIPENFGYPAVFFNRRFFRRCIRQADGIVCVSEVTRKKLSTYFPSIAKSKKCAVVYSAANIERGRHATVSPRITGRFVLTVGQHRANKNLDLIIEAYRRLKAQGRIDQQMRLVIVGVAGPETERLVRRVSDWQLQNDVLFLSGLTDAELISSYDNCSAFVAASSTEGFCLPLAEVLSCGAPCVCSDIPVLREVCAGECGFFSLEGTPVENLCNVLEQTLGEECKRRSGIRGARFSKQESARGYLELYQDVLAETSTMDEGFDVPFTFEDCAC
jgi:glycosyltransferase involved in cell wall biosynthesis